MSKMSPFRGSFEKWEGKRAKTLFKAERQTLYHFDWSLWRQPKSKKSLGVIYKILGVFNNPLTADDKYSLLNRRNLLQHFQMPLSQKRKIFSLFLLHFLNLDPILNIFKKKTLIADVFLNLRTPKTWLDKCQKSPVSEDPSTSNMVNGTKHRWNLNHSTFTIFIDPCEEN